MSDLTMDVLQGLLHGLSTRQRVISDNIANIETPGFTAKRVEFEDALKEAIQNGKAGDMTPRVVASDAPRMPNGNNVSVDQEIVSLQEVSLQYQLAIEAVTAKLNLIRSSMRSSI